METPKAPRWVILAIATLSAALGLGHYLVVANAQEVTVANSLKAEMRGVLRDSTTLLIIDSDSFPSTAQLAETLRDSLALVPGGLTQRRLTGLIEVTERSRDGAVFTGYAVESPWVRCSTESVRPQASRPPDWIDLGCSVDAIQRTTAPFVFGIVLLGLVAAGGIAKLWAKRPGVRVIAGFLIAGLMAATLVSGSLQAFVPRFDAGGRVLGDSIWNAGMLLP